MSTVTIDPGLLVGVDVTTQTVTINAPTSLTLNNYGEGSVVAEYSFESASTEWVVNHNRGGPVLVDVTNLAGDQLVADIARPTDNQVRITHAAPATGVVLIS